MDLQTSHLAAALMSGNNTFVSAQPESATGAPDNNVEDTKKGNPNESRKESAYEDKEEIASGEEFSDEVFGQKYN